MIKNILLNYVIFFFVSTTNAQIPKGNRILAWQVDMAQNNNYDSAFAYAQTACLESVHSYLKWTDIEPDTGTYDTTFITSYLDIINFINYKI